MKLFVIGNGFDLAHEINSSYYDFRDYLEEENCIFLNRLESMYGLLVGEWIDYVSEEIWKTRFKEYLWREFESNLSDIDQDIIYNGEEIELGLESGDIGIEDTLNNYWEDQYGFIERLNYYLMDWVKQIDIRDIVKKTSIINKCNNDKFITFNYTLVLETVYNIDNEDILHIHGSIDKNDFPPVIGHGDREKIDEMLELSREAREECDEKRCSIYNAVAKYYERTLKNVSEFLKINDRFFKSLGGVDKIYIIGHSLGDVDIPYFKKILENVGDNTRWYVHFHKSEDEENYKNKIVSIGVNQENITMLRSEEIFNI